MARRKPSEEERKLWRAAMRGVTPLHDWQEEDPPEPLIPPQVVKPDSIFRPKALPRPEADAAATPLPDRFDAESERRLRSCQLVIESRLDLHGMTEAGAHQAALAFLGRASAARQALVLIITGKGSMGTGVLKRSLRPWLEGAPPALRGRIRAIRPAEPRHGGNGAFYILLKRK
jgi:DNA-nicking Smr family endonuclease